MHRNSRFFDVQGWRSRPESDSLYGYGAAKLKSGNN